MNKQIIFFTQLQYFLEIKHPLRYNKQLARQTTLEHIII